VAVGIPLADLAVTAMEHELCVVDDPADRLGGGRAI
jgi:hypothetical protein